MMVRMVETAEHCRAQLCWVLMSALAHVVRIGFGIEVAAVEKIQELLGCHEVWA